MISLILMFFSLRYTASTLFEPIDARRAFPCFDEPALKANFSMSIVREKKFISLFNMPRVHSIPFGENLMLDTFQQSVKMSTYLVAFAVCEFEGKSKLSKSGVNVSMRSFVLYKDELSKFKRAKTVVNI